MTANSKTYLSVKWFHDSKDYPTLLISELDAQRYETRKLEFFPNGKVGLADDRRHTEDTRLGKVKVPPLSEINSDKEFEGHEITSVEFEDLWKKHAGTTPNE